jgi:hypothetical protein
VLLTWSRRNGAGFPGSVGAARAPLRA